MNNIYFPEGNSDYEVEIENYDSENENIIDDYGNIINPNLAAIPQEYIQFETNSGNWALNYSAHNYIVKRKSDREITWICKNKGSNTTLFCQYDINPDGSLIMRDEDEGIVNFYNFHYSTSSRIQNPVQYYLIHKLARDEITILMISGTYSFMEAYNHMVINAMVLEARVTFSNRAVNRAQQTSYPPNPTNAVEVEFADERKYLQNNVDVPEDLFVLINILVDNI
jgi:hypothetical protein